jgi:hypothetical protein
VLELTKEKIKNFFDKISADNNKYLPAKISLLAFGLGLLMVWIGDYMFGNSSFESLVYSYSIKILFFGILGLAGFIVMVRGELHQFFVIRGRLARLYGLLWWLISWWIAIRALISLYNILT